MNKRRHEDQDDGHDSAPTGERLQRVLAQRGVASRRASEALITGGRVQVNGQVVSELGTRVNPTRDEIRVDGNVVRRQRPRFIILNKPTGFITTVSDEKQRWTVMDLVEVEERVYPVGRLDRATQGIILLTNEGEVANRVMHPRYNLAKEYHVVTRKKPTDQQLQTLREGILVEDRVVVPDECRLLRESPEGIIIKIVLHEGMYHVVRAMMESVGIDIDKLRRVRIGPLTLTGIPPGAWRDLTPGELQQLYQAIGLPASEADEMNARRPQQLTPVGGFQHKPKIRHPQRFREGGGRRGNVTSDSEDRGPATDEHRGGKTERRDRREGTGFGPGRSDNESTGPARRRTGRPAHGDTRTSGRREGGKARSPQGHRDRRPGRGR